jgi:threonine/homoserine/homoserine lactone efflux protein
MDVFVDIPGFLLASLLLELTPGPNMTWLALLASTRGQKAGFATIVGITLGLGIWVVAAAFGAAAAIDAIPQLLPVLKLAGAAYLLWLAIEAWRGAETAPATTGGDAKVALIDHVRHGLVTNLLNAKAALFFVTFLPTHLAEHLGRSGATTGLLFLGALYLAISVVVHSGVVLAASQMQGLLSGLGAIALRRGCALAIAATAIWLALG